MQLEVHAGQFFRCLEERGGLPVFALTACSEDEKLSGEGRG